MQIGANSSKPHPSACKLLVNKTEKDFSLQGGTKFQNKQLQLLIHPRQLQIYSIKPKLDIGLFVDLAEFPCFYQFPGKNREIQLNQQFRKGNNSF
jgi:hypothetical protein